MEGPCAVLSLLLEQLSLSMRESSCEFSPMKQLSPLRNSRATYCCQETIGHPLVGTEWLTWLEKTTRSHGLNSFLGCATYLSSSEIIWMQRSHLSLTHVQTFVPRFWLIHHLNSSAVTVEINCSIADTFFRYESLASQMTCKSSKDLFGSVGDLCFTVPLLSTVPLATH